METNMSITPDIQNGTNFTRIPESKKFDIPVNQTLLNIIVVYGAAIFSLNIAIVIFLYIKSKNVLKQGIHTLCLSVSDALTGIVICLLFGMTNYYVPSALCDVTFLLFLSSQSATGFQLLAISIERFYILRNVDKVIQPKFRHSLYVFLIWMGVIAAHIIPTISDTNRVPIDHWSRCRPGRVFGTTTNPAGMLYSIIYVLPLVAVNGFYLVTMVALKRRFNLSKDLKPGPDSVVSAVENNRQKFADKRRKQQQQIYITFFVILISLDISVLPKILHFILTKNDGEVNISMAMAALCSINSFLNPIVYAFRWSEIRSLLLTKCVGNCRK